MSIWVSPADVKSMTGSDVDNAAIAQATLAIEIITRADLSDPDRFIEDSDRFLLKRAIAAQAAWTVSNTSKINGDYASISQDGLSVTFRDDGSTARNLAPLARAAVVGLSWMRPQTIRLGKSDAVRRYEKQIRNGPIVTSGGITHWGTAGGDVYVSEVA